MVDNQVVSMADDGVLVSFTKGGILIPWLELKAGYFLIKGGQSFQLGVQVGLHIARMMAANDS